VILDDAARVIRSKNAGPFTLTLDIFFSSSDTYELARRSTLMTPEGVAEAYGVPVNTVRGVYWDERVLASKVSLQRWTSSADPFCSDMFGAHLHLPLSRSEL
jgi:hypothetical protein